MVDSSSEHCRGVTAGNGRIRITFTRVWLTIGSADKQLKFIGIYRDRRSATQTSSTAVVVVAPFWSLVSFPRSRSRPATPNKEKVAAYESLLIPTHFSFYCSCGRNALYPRLRRVTLSLICANRWNSSWMSPLFSSSAGRYVWPPTDEAGRALPQFS